jgi:hypothetical protein
MTAPRARPATGSGVGFGLEAWLIGTPAELDAALGALAAAGRVRWQGIGRPGARVPLAGADYGRFRAYALIYMPLQPGSGVLPATGELMGPASPAVGTSSRSGSGR